MTSKIKINDIEDSAGGGNTTLNGQQIYSRGNVLGTVSEVAGVPTGAIIERGSNANGEYVKYADGTMICNGANTTAAGGSVAVTLPASYVNDEYFVHAACDNSTNQADRAFKFAGHTTTQFTAYGTIDGTFGVIVFRWFTFGRWY